MQAKSTGRFPSWAPFALIGLAVMGAGGAALPTNHVLAVDAPKDDTEKKERELVRAALRNSFGKREWKEIDWEHKDGEKKGTRIVTITLKVKNDLGMEMTSTLEHIVENGKIVAVDIK